MVSLLSVMSDRRPVVCICAQESSTKLPQAPVDQKPHKTTRGPGPGGHPKTKKAAKTWHYQLERVLAGRLRISSRKGMTFPQYPRSTTPLAGKSVLVLHKQTNNRLQTISRRINPMTTDKGSFQKITQTDQQTTDDVERSRQLLANLIGKLLARTWLSLQARENTMVSQGQEGRHDGPQ